MACCNSSCVQCSEAIRDDRDERDAYWNKIHKGGPNLSEEDLKKHKIYKNNEKIYNEIYKLQKRIEDLQKQLTNSL